MDLTVIDLFCGVGGLSLGAARAGFSLSLCVDADKTPLEVHEQNFPNCNHLLCDVQGLSGTELLKHADLSNRPLTGLIGGPPCQGFSRIGKRRVDDPRNQLFAQFFRLTLETRPLFYMAENVLGILDDQNKDVVKYGLSLVAAHYVQSEPIVVNASDFGAATKRQRVFFIGFRKDAGINWGASDLIHQKWKSSTTVGHALRGLPKKLKEAWSVDENGWRKIRTRPEGKFGESISGDIPAGIGHRQTVELLTKHQVVSGCISTSHTLPVLQRWASLKPGGVDDVSRATRLEKTGLCPTLRAGTGPDRGSFQALRPIHFSEDRMISPREAARLQGFPDWFRLHPTKWHAFRGIGNSVSPLLAEAVLSSLYQSIKRVLREQTTPRDGSLFAASAH